jgi:basic membrane protein A
MTRNKINIISLITALTMFLFTIVVHYCYEYTAGEKHITKVGFVYEGDESTPYTDNFLDATKAIEEKFGDSVQCIIKKNVANGSEGKQIEKLVEEGCELIFCNSYSYENTTKEMAGIYPQVQFCQATGDNAGVEPMYDNYHTYMGEVYEGRYASGVVAGLKLQEIIKEGKLKPEQAVVGYVAAFPYSEVISGYTAFILGIRSVVPEATMRVAYINSWNNYTLEKEYAKKFIDEGCVIISQHSDTAGPAVACEETDASKLVYHVGYSQDMKKIAPTTHLVSCRINWEPYMVNAVEAVVNKSSIESNMKCHVWGNDTGGGFADGWVELLKLNEQVVAKDTAKKIDYVIKQLENHKIGVFSGNYTGVNPNNPEDKCDLRIPFRENENRSSPSFNYILDNVVTIEK